MAASALVPQKHREQVRLRKLLIGGEKRPQRNSCLKRLAIVALRCASVGRGSIGHCNNLKGALEPGLNLRRRGTGEIAAGKDILKLHNLCKRKAAELRCCRPAPCAVRGRL